MLSLFEAQRIILAGFHLADRTTVGTDSGTVGSKRVQIAPGSHRTYAEAIHQIADGYLSFLFKQIENLPPPLLGEQFGSRGNCHSGVHNCNCKRELRSMTAAIPGLLFAELYLFLVFFLTTFYLFLFTFAFGPPVRYFRQFQRSSQYEETYFSHSCAGRFSALHSQFGFWSRN